MALISTDLGDRFGGQELALEAASYFDENNPQHHAYLLSIYNNLGIASYGLQQYPKAIEFYTKSLQFITDSAHTRIVKNNIANSYRKAGERDKALAIFKSILDKENEPVNRARILSNYAYTRWLANPNNNPVPDLQTALRLRLKEGDLADQNSSYAHLADYYMKNKPDSALFYSAKMYQGSISLHSAQDQIEALQKLIQLSQPEDSRKYFNRYRKLEDSIQNAWSNAKNQFAVIRYETEKHKADNLLLQKENTSRNVWIVSLAVVLIAGSLTGIFWNRRRERYLAIKAANAVRESQLKTSKKVHDVVANGLYRLMSEVENVAEFDRERVLDDMEILYERSRDISYDDQKANFNVANFQNAVSILLMSFATPETRVVIVGNTGELWLDFSQEARDNLYYVLQELMVNMTKHSHADSVAIRFERNQDEIKVFYTDNGAGLPDDVVYRNGLTNTGNRIRSIHGIITFGEGATGGLKVEIQIPVRQ